MDWLQGKQVVFTGKLASMTRKEAARLIARHGGQSAATVNRQTDFVVVGQEGWPLQHDGKLTGKLRSAGKLQDAGLPLAILCEEEFLARLGLEERSEDVHRLYTQAQLMRLLGIPRERLRAWLQEGLIQPREEADGIAYFDFRQVQGAKTLWDMFQAGVGLDRVRRSLRQLRNWVKDADQPLAQLALLEENGRLLIRVEEGLAEASGQLFLEFEQTEQIAVVPVQAKTAEEWFDLGCWHEDEGRLEEAIDAYRQALIAGGPDLDVTFNLANVLFAAGHKAEAGERFRQVVEAEPGHAEAWNNLGIVLSQINRAQEAEACFRRAIDLHHADARYNLADLLETQGRKQEAREHWQAFLRTGSNDAWTRYARQRLRG